MFELTFTFLYSRLDFKTFFNCMQTCVSLRWNHLNKVEKWRICDFILLYVCWKPNYRRVFSLIFGKSSDFYNLVDLCTFRDNRLAFKQSGESPCILVLIIPKYTMSEKSLWPDPFCYSSHYFCLKNANITLRIKVSDSQ